MEAVTVLAQCRHKKYGHGVSMRGRECSSKFFLREGKRKKTEQKREGKAKPEGGQRGVVRKEERSVGTKDFLFLFDLRKL